MADIVRWLALCFYVYDAAWGIAVMRVWVRDSHPEYKKILLRHVITVAAFAELALFSFTATAIDRLGHPFVWYLTPVELAAAAFFAVGLHELPRWLRARNKRWPQYPHGGEA